LIDLKTRTCSGFFMSEIRWFLSAHFAEAGAGVVEKPLDLGQRRGGEGDQAYAFVGLAFMLGEHALVYGVLYILHRGAPANVGHQVVEVGFRLRGTVAHEPHLGEKVAVVQIAETGISKGFCPKAINSKNRLGCLNAVVVGFAHGYVRIP
jgi:hypothetical protein